MYLLFSKYISKVHAGWFVDYAPYVMGRRKEIWGDDAEEFRPERFLTTVCVLYCVCLCVCVCVCVCVFVFVCLFVFCSFFLYFLKNVVAFVVSIICWNVFLLLLLHQVSLLIFNVIHHHQSSIINYQSS